MSQLSQIFTNIANAIRSKTGSNELITPPEMATAIDNIPSGGGAIAYAWDFEDEPSGDTGTDYFSFDVAPETTQDYLNTKYIQINIDIDILQNSLNGTYSKRLDTEFSIHVPQIEEYDPYTIHYTRNSSKDINIWEWVPTGGGGGGEEG